MAAQQRAEVIRRIRDAFPDFDPRVKVPIAERKVCEKLFAKYSEVGANYNQRKYDWLVDLMLWQWYCKLPLFSVCYVSLTDCPAVGLKDKDDQFTWPDPRNSNEPPFSIKYREYCAEQGTYAGKASKGSVPRAPIPLAPGPRTPVPKAQYATPNTQRVLGFNPQITTMLGHGLGDWAEGNVCFDELYLHPSKTLWLRHHSEEPPFLKHKRREWEMFLDPDIRLWKFLVTAEMLTATRWCINPLVSVVMWSDMDEKKPEITLAIVFRKGTQRTAAAEAELNRLWTAMMRWYNGVCKNTGQTFQEFVELEYGTGQASNAGGSNPLTQAAGPASKAPNTTEASMGRYKAVFNKSG